MSCAREVANGVSADTGGVKFPIFGKLQLSVAVRREEGLKPKKKEENLKQRKEKQRKTKGNEEKQEKQRNLKILSNGNLVYTNPF